MSEAWAGLGSPQGSWQREAALIVLSCLSAEEPPQQPEGPQEPRCGLRTALKAGCWLAACRHICRPQHSSHCFVLGTCIALPKSKIEESFKLSLLFIKNESMYSLLLNVHLLCGVELLECPKLAYLYLTSRKECVRLRLSSWHCYRFPSFLVSGILLFLRLKSSQ